MIYDVLKSFELWLVRSFWLMGFWNTINNLAFQFKGHLQVDWIWYTDDMTASYIEETFVYTTGAAPFNTVDTTILIFFTTNICKEL